ncbi:MAG: hypothetical protein AAGD17_05540 [Bacteroidota bacterium]
MKNSLFFFLTISILLVLGCSSSDDQTDPDIPEVDTTAPTISINGLSDTLETLSTITISISDVSETVSSSITLNGNEILSSTEKQFSLEIDPFDFPNGNTTLVVTSTDANNNEGMESVSFELRRLLFRIAAPFFPANNQVYFSANALDGSLLGTTQVTTPRDIVNVYAEEEIPRQQLVVTSYVLQPDFAFQTLNSIANIESGTDLVVLQEAAGIANINTFMPGMPGPNLNITINDIPDEDLALSVYAAGVDYFGNNPSASMINPMDYSSALTLRREEEVLSPFIYTSSIFNLNGIIIDLDDYRYTFLDELTDKTLSFSDFMSPTETQTIAIPSITNAYSLSLFGFENQNQYDNGLFRTIYDTRSTFSSSSQTFSGITLPIIDAFDIVSTSIFLGFDDERTMNIATRGLKDITIPNWTAVPENNEIVTSGDYNIYGIELSANGIDNTTLFWSYTGSSQERISLPFETFELPAAVAETTRIQNIDFGSLHTNSNITIGLIGFEQDATYEEMIFQPFVLGGLGDRTTLRFPVNDTTN